MATRRRRRKSPTRRRVTRRRRRKNPSVPFKALGVGILAGAALGGADYALAGQDKIPAKWTGAVEAAAGLLLGGLASMYQQDLGVGLAAAGVGLGVANSMQHFVKSSATSTTTTSGLYGPRAVAQLRAVQAPLEAVGAPVGGGVYADMSAVQAVLEGI